MTSTRYGSAFDDTRDRHGSLTMEVLRILLTVLFPPLGVYLRVRFTVHFWMSLLLTCLAYLPGLVHGIWLLAQSSRFALRLPER